jgi:hypothetical protein
MIRKAPLFLASLLCQFVTLRAYPNNWHAWLPKAFQGVIRIGSKLSAGWSGRSFPLFSSSVIALPSRQIEQKTASFSQEASHLLVRNTHLLAHFSRADRGEADQGFHLRVRRSSTTQCLNASSSSLSKSLAGFAGEVSLQQMASHFPSLPIVFLAVFTAHGRL